MHQYQFLYNENDIYSNHRNGTKMWYKVDLTSGARESESPEGQLEK